MPKRWSIQLILEDVPAPGIGGGADVDEDDSPYRDEKTYKEGEDPIAREDYRKLKRCVKACVKEIKQS
jgi:hypothetical protein